MNIVFDLIDLIVIFTEHEVNFIRLLDRMTNGSCVKINETGTELNYSPGLLIGGQLEHDCSLERGIGYYLEAIIAVAPFCKNPVDIKLRGITNNTSGKLSCYLILC